ncbi:uncharacterized protein ACBR49_012970 [Aulostomus maculatus]
MEVLPAGGLAIPLPAAVLIAVILYMGLLGVGLWLRIYLKGRCSSACGGCCPHVPVGEKCFQLAETCDCRTPTLHSCLANLCSSPSCGKWDCACTCQPPECDSCNCLCFEIRIK